MSSSAASPGIWLLPRCSEEKLHNRQPNSVLTKSDTHVKIKEAKKTQTGVHQMSDRSIRSVKLDLRLMPEAKKKIQLAAESTGRSVSEFVLESALARADETLADRTRFGLDAERWQQFQEALDAPPRQLPRLALLLQEPGVFDGKP